MNYELQSTLARLLAKENITVTHGNMKTAYFDVKNRVLGLPMWQNKTKDVYDMLVGHEVGHALYTPENGVEKFRSKCGQIPFDVCNIVEDIRIERMIQSSYPGLPRVFRKAYSELVEDDFFGTKSKNIPELGFLDRLNLRGKVGSHVAIPLEDDEELIYQKCLKAETFDDVLDICLEIKDMLTEKDQPEQEQSENASDDSSDDAEQFTEQESSSSDGEGDEETDDGEKAKGDDSDSDETDDGEEAGGGDSDSDETEDGDASSDNIDSSDETDTDGDASDASASDGASEDVPQELISETLEDFDRKLEDTVKSGADMGFMPVMLPRRDYIYDTIIDYNTLRESRKNAFHVLESSPDYKAQTEEKFIQFKKATNRKVGTLVREFEQRKAAYQYSRATESRTGKLDVNKLHNYKLTDELFLSQTQLADAKSHGMIFLLDYSGSMGTVLKDVIDQTLNLVTFCKKVGIPFRVYSFTNTFATKNLSTIKPTINEVDLNTVVLVEHITSEMSKTTYEEAFKHLWTTRNAYGCADGCYDKLGGTPLDTVLTMMPTIIKDFVKKNGIQKTTFVTLTDGESSNINTTHSWEDTKNRIKIKLNNKVYDVSRYASTNDLIKMIGDSPNVTTIGFYLPSNRKHVSRILARVSKNQEDLKKMKKNHKKNGFAEVNNHAYNAYYILDSDVEVKDTEFTTIIDDDAANSRRAQTKLAKAFGAHNIKNRQTRILLTSLAEKIA